MVGLIWGIAATAGCVALYIAMTTFLKYKSSEQPESAEVYEYPKLDIIMVDYDIELKKRKYLTKKYEAIRLQDKIVDAFSHFVFDEINKTAQYVENDDGELHAVIDCAKVRAVMDKLALEHSFIREKVWPQNGVKRCDL